MPYLIECSRCGQTCTLPTEGMFSMVDVDRTPLPTGWYILNYGTNRIEAPKVRHLCPDCMRKLRTFLGDD